METLILRFKNKKNYKLIKELASQLEDQGETYLSKKKVNKKELQKQLPKSKFKSNEEFLSFAGSMKGQYISKEHLRSRVWKERT